MSQRMMRFAFSSVVAFLMHGCSDTSNFPATPCSAGQTRCTDTSFERCEQGEWSSVQTCDRSHCSESGCTAGTAEVCSREGASVCNGVVREVCQGRRWVPVETCASGVCAAGVCADCASGQTQCSGKFHDQTCRPDGRWTDPHECESSLGETCSPVSQHCGRGTDTCSPAQLGAFVCEGNNSVSRCVNVGGVRERVPEGQCGAGYVHCLETTPVAASTSFTEACINACGRRGAPLDHMPGERVSGSRCARWICDERRELVISHRDCRIVGDVCEIDQDCASLNCAADGRCGPPRNG